MKKKIILSDFDGTLTSHDTLIEFIRFAKGNVALLFALLLFSPMLVLMKLHLYNNGKAKQRLFSYFFKGMTLEDFNALCYNFGSEKHDLLRQGGIEMTFAAMMSGTPVFVVSASIDNWVRPFFYPNEGDYIEGEPHPIEIIGTQIEVKNGRLTGHFLTPNCYGAEKVRRVKAALPDLVENRSNYFIIAYGDSRGDKEMLAFADETHYKPWR